MHSKFSIVSIQILLISFLLTPLRSQELAGKIVNTSDEPLAGVNVYLMEANSGTITNGEGHFYFKLPEGQSTVVFSYIGYQNDSLVVHLIKDEKQSVQITLQETVLEGGAIYVFAKQFNDAQEIVYKTIENKKAYLSSIQNYVYDAYHKTVFKVDVNNQRIIGGLIETKSKGFHKYPDLFQEQVLAKKQSKNFSNLTNVFTVGRIPNLLEESLTFDEQRVLSPLSDKALDYYHYEMQDTTYWNNRMVFNINFEPKLESLPLFNGRMSIIDRDFAVISCELYGGEQVKTIMRDKIIVSQSFRQFENKYWFPVTMHMSSRINMDIPVLPYLYWNQDALISNYEINSNNFNYTFDENQLSYQIQSEKLSNEIWSAEQAIPLNSAEKKALRHIDSVVTNTNFIKKSILWGMANFDKLLVTGFYDFYHYNRVQGSYLGVGIDSRRTWRDSQIKFRTGYGFADDSYTYDIWLRQAWFKKRLETQIRFMNKLEFVDAFYRYNPTDITTQTLTRKNDYADYQYRSGFELMLNYQMNDEFDFGVMYSADKQKLAENTQSWTKPKKIREAFPVEAGNYRTVEFSLASDDLKYFDYGWLVAPDMSQDFYDLQVRYLFSSDKFLKSDADFERWYIYFSLFQQAPPWVNIYFRLNAGILSGQTPLQYYFHLAGSYGSFGNPVQFRTITRDQFLSDRFFVLALENNFKNTFFNLFHIPFLQKSKIDFLVFSNLAWMHTPEIEGSNFNTIRLTNDPLTEVGISLGNLFTFFRIDFTWRLNYQTSQNFRINLTSRLFIR